ncbi:MAG: hypothetical protein WCT44_03750 [Candidatus Paceibacterota bacterium]
MSTGKIIGIAVGAVLGIVLLFWAGSKCTGKGKSTTTTTRTSSYVEQSAPTPPPVQQATKVLVLPPVRCTTPCVDITADYPFELDSDGPIVQYFPGIDEPVEYSGKGDFHVNKPRDPGPFTIKSKNKKEEVEVRIYEMRDAYILPPP